MKTKYPWLMLSISCSFLLGWFIGIHRSDPTGREFTESRRPNTDGNHTGGIPTMASQIPSNNYRVSDSAAPVPRAEILLTRETNAANDAIRILATRRDDLWSRLANSGMAFTNFEKLYQSMVDHQKLYFLAEAATVDLLKTRSEFQQVLTNSLSQEAVRAFSQQEKSLAATYLSESIDAAAAPNHISISSDQMSLIRNAIVVNAAFIETPGSPFGQLPEPAYGAAESQEYLSKRADKLEIAAENFYKSIQGKIPDDVLSTIKKLYTEQISADRNSLTTLRKFAEMGPVIPGELEALDAATRKP